jgi:hypothetical protein
VLTWHQFVAEQNSRTGEHLDAAVPSPSPRTKLFPLPQDHKEPSVFIAEEKSFLEDMKHQFVAEQNSRTGEQRDVTVPSPRRPHLLYPQEYTFKFVALSVVS